MHENARSGRRRRSRTTHTKYRTPICPRLTNALQTKAPRCDATPPLQPATHGRVLPFVGPLPFLALALEAISIP